MSETNNNTMIISIIGRPNVGKSTLFNRLMKKSTKALAYDKPGVTRDRHYGITTFEEADFSKPREVILVDTGGFYPKELKPENGASQKADFEVSLFNLMRVQAKKSIDESDLILFVVDVREGPMPFDMDIANYLRQTNKPFLLVVNKFDTPKQNGTEAEFYDLGIDSTDFYLVSSTHNQGILTLEKRAHQFILDREDLIEREIPLWKKGLVPRKEIVSKVAIIGVPNVGKSTLLNRLLKSERSLVSSIPGTTIDPVEGYLDLFFGPDTKNTPVEFEEGDEDESLENNDTDFWKTIRIVDTAGIRKSSKVEEAIEQQSVYRSLSCISEADIVLYMVDATNGLGHQDRRLMDIAFEKGKSLIICLNKIDLMAHIFNDKEKRKEWLADLRWKIPWLDFCDVIPIGAKDGKNMSGLKRAIIKTIAIRNQDISTSAINNTIEELMIRNPVMMKGKKVVPLKLKYASLVKKSPPTFLLFTNRSKDIPDNYRKYLQNGLREAFNIRNTPVHIVIRRTDENIKKARLVEE